MWWWLSWAAAQSLVSAGASHSCALSEGQVLCWGGATVAQLKGDGSPRKQPTRIEGLPAAVSVSAGGRGESCAVAADGAVWCWGLDEPPQRVPDVVDAVSVSVGGAHACAQTRAGAVRCWGSDRSGQLGGAAPGAVLEGLPTVREVRAGEQHTCAAAASGAVWCWGGNAQGQLGRLPLAEQLAPAPVAFLQDATSIGAGGFHSCAVRQGGEVLCWGDNLSGQLGDGSRRPSAEVVAPRGVSGARALGLGFAHSCAVLRDGAVSCWGASDRGQIGLATNEDQLLPGRVPGLSSVVQVSGGQQHSCVVAEGTVWCMGSNTTSQLGDGGRERRHEPRPVAYSLSTGDVPK